jgi:EAL domain-containing protein (putative c-di-GMP-specific phosphodiesterase class I)
MALPRFSSHGRARLLARVIWACLIGVYWQQTASGTGSAVITHGLYVALLSIPSAFVLGRAFAVREQRAAWAAMGVGLILWTLGSVVEVILDLGGETPPFPSVSDALWLSIYPCALVALGVLGRGQFGRPPKGLIRDSVMVIIVLTAAVNALVLPAVLDNAAGLSGLAQVVLFAYPLGDSLLMALAVTAAVFLGWRNGLVMRLIAIGAAMLLMADVLWALSASGGAWQPIMSSNALYVLWPTLVAAAAWSPPGARGPFRIHGEGVRVLGTVLVAVLAAIGLLVANEWVDVPRVAVVLAALGLLAAINRSAASLADGIRASRALARRQAAVDDVGRALAAGELLLHFQPLIAIDDGAVQGAEALLRWNRDGELVAPDEFIPVIEQSALMGPVTHFVIDAALEALAGWRRAGHDIGVSVNLAVRNLSEDDLAARVAASLTRHGIPAAALTLEVTETSAIDDDETVERTLDALDRLGVELSIDDFGTGHSSLVRLAHFPIDELKIDRSFVQELGMTDRPIVATAVQLAHTLGLRVVAEGVETIGTLNALRAMGCDVAQGYFVSRPLAQGDFGAWLDARAAPDPAGSRSVAGARAVLDELVDELDMDAAFVAEFVGERKVLRMFEGETSFGPLHESSVLPRSESYCDRVVRGVFPNVIADAQEDPRTQGLSITQSADLGAYLGIPLYHDNGDLYGTLCCISHEARPGLADHDVEAARRAAVRLRPLLATADLTVARRKPATRFPPPA